MSDIEATPTPEREKADYKIVVYGEQATGNKGALRIVGANPFQHIYGYSILSPGRPGQFPAGYLSLVGVPQIGKTAFTHTEVQQLLTDPENPKETNPNFAGFTPIDFTRPAEISSPGLLQSKGDALDEVERKIRIRSRQLYGEVIMWKPDGTRSQDVIDSIRQEMSKPGS